MAPGCGLVSVNNNHFCNVLNTVCSSPMFRINIYTAKLPNYQLYDSHRRSPINTSVPFANASISMINLNVKTHEHFAAFMNIASVIVQ